MFAQSMTEQVVNQTGAGPDLRYFHTTYGTTFGYNERARKYHRSYGLVTPPTNPAYDDYRLGDLAVAPLYRRNHLGFRVEYPDSHFTWSESASKLKKNQKRYGEDDQTSVTSTSTLPPRQVRFYPSRSSLLDPPESRWEDDTGSAQASARDEERLRQQREEFERAYAEKQRQRQLDALPLAKDAVSTTGRAYLTSSLSPEPSASAVGRNPQMQRADHLNAQLYPTPALKRSQFNPQFNVGRK